MAEARAQEFQAEQRAFFDKALLAGLVAVTAGWQSGGRLNTTQMEKITDDAVLIALELTRKRQVQFDNGEI
jgi:hypothetical protein